jgi:hypothetical protein
MITTVTSEKRGGADIQVRRDFDNILLPVFQFGIFTENDLELYTPPSWSFGGGFIQTGDFYVTGQPPTNNISFARYTIDGSGNLVTAAGQITVAKHMVLGYEKTGVANTGSMIVYRDATNYDTITAGSAITGAKIDGCNRVDKGTFDVVGASACGTFSGTSSGSIKIALRDCSFPSRI